MGMMAGASLFWHDVRAIAGAALQRDRAAVPPSPPSAGAPPGCGRPAPTVAGSGVPDPNSPAQSRSGTLESSDDSNSLAPLPSQAGLFSAESSLATTAPPQAPQQLQRRRRRQQEQHSWHPSPQSGGATAQLLTSPGTRLASATWHGHRTQQLSPPQQHQEPRTAEGLLVFAEEPSNEQDNDSQWPRGNATGSGPFACEAVPVLQNHAAPGRRTSFALLLEVVEHISRALEAEEIRAATARRPRPFRTGALAVAQAGSPSATLSPTGHDDRSSRSISDNSGNTNHTLVASDDATPTAGTVAHEVAAAARAPQGPGALSCVQFRSAWRRLRRLARDSHAPPPPQPLRPSATTTAASSDGGGRGWGSGGGTTSAASGSRCQHDDSRDHLDHSDNGGGEGCGEHSGGTQWDVLLPGRPPEHQGQGEEEAAADDSDNDNNDHDGERAEEGGQQGAPPALPSSVGELAAVVGVGAPVAAAVAAYLRRAGHVVPLLHRRPPRW